MELFQFIPSTPFFNQSEELNIVRQPIAALLCTGMLERGEIDVAVTDLSLTFPRAQVTTFFKLQFASGDSFSRFLKAP